MNLLLFPDDARPLALGAAVRALRSVCDGAHDRDDVGFNQADARLGHRLGSIPEDQWSPRQRWALYRTLAKYRGQLERLGVPYDRLEVPARPAREDVPDRSIFLREDGAFGLTYEYGLDLGVSWVELRPVWVREVRHHRALPTKRGAKALRGLVDRLHFEISAEALQLVEHLEAEVATEGAGKIQVHPAHGFALLFEYDAMLNDAVKRIPGARFRKEETGPGGVWTVPAERAAVEALLAFASAKGFVWDEIALAAARALVKAATGLLEASKAAAADLEVPGLGGTLRPFQRAGVAYILHAFGVDPPARPGGVFVCDEPGLGKTIEALATAQALQARPTLVVCPASAKLNWVRETVIWLPGWRVSWLNGGTAEAFPVRVPGRGTVYVRANDLQADVVVINFDLLKKWEAQLLEIPWKLLVCDESHNCKNPKAIRTQAVQRLADKGVRWRLAMSGTPLLNRPEELIAPLRMLGRLDAFGGWSGFARRFCRATMTRFGWDLKGAANLEELNERLRQLCYLRRTKADVLGELPAKIYAVVPVELSNLAEYRRAEADIIAWIRSRAAQDAAFLESLRGLGEEARRAAMKRHSEDAAERAARAEMLVRIGALKRIAAAGKLTGAVAWVQDFLSSGRKLVVFAHHQEIQRALYQAVPSSRPAHLFGDDSALVRDTEIRRFQTDPKCRVFVASLRAGREAITLHAASDVVFLEQGWTPAEHRQAEDRLHRIGQTDSVTCYYLLASGTIDEDIRELIEAKRHVVDTATEGEGGGGADSILGELAARLLKKGGA